MNVALDGRVATGLAVIERGSITSCSTPPLPAPTALASWSTAPPDL
ncbi:hypothetical protein [Janthinobacterium sp. MDT1-19]